MLWLVCCSRLAEKLVSLNKRVYFLEFFVERSRLKVCRNYPKDMASPGCENTVFDAIRVTVSFMPLIFLSTLSTKLSSSSMFLNWASTQKS